MESIIMISLWIIALCSIVWIVIRWMREYNGHDYVDHNDHTFHDFYTKVDDDIW